MGRDIARNGKRGGAELLSSNNRITRFAGISKAPQTPTQTSPPQIKKGKRRERRKERKRRNFSPRLNDASLKLDSIEGRERFLAKPSPRRHFRADPRTFITARRRDITPPPVAREICDGANRADTWHRCNDVDSTVILSHGRVFKSTAASEKERQKKEWP